MSNTYYISFIKHDTSVHIGNQQIHCLDVILIGSTQDKNNISELLEKSNLEDLLKNRKGFINCISPTLEDSQSDCLADIEQFKKDKSIEIVLIDIHQAIASKTIKSKMKEEFGS